MPTIGPMTVRGMDHVGVVVEDLPAAIEFFVALLVRFCRQLTGREVVPDKIRLMHGRTQLPTELRSFFGCEIAFGAGADEVALPRAVGDAAIVSADPFLNALLERAAERYPSAFVAKLPGCVKKVIAWHAAPLLNVGANEASTSPVVKLYDARPGRT